MNLGYVISTIIASLILLSLVGLNSRIMRSSGEQTLYTMAKIDSDMVIDYMKEDMRSMGYGIDGTAITIAEPNRIRFLVHFEGNADPTAIDWWFDEDASASGSNPNFRPLYRRQTAESVSATYDPATDPDAFAVGNGIVDVRFEYLDAQRQVISDPGTQPENIRQIRMQLIAESGESYDPDRFERSTWEGEITPFNLASN